MSNQVVHQSREFCCPVSAGGRYLSRLMVGAIVVLLCGPLAAQQGDVQATDQQSQQSMSAEQIVAILQQDPGALTALKNTAAQRLSVDPNSISDEDVFEELRQDASLRDQASAELSKHGYSIDTGTSGELQTLRPESQNAESLTESQSDGSESQSTGSRAQIRQSGGGRGCGPARKSVTSAHGGSGAEAKPKMIRTSRMPAA